MDNGLTFLITCLNSQDRCFSGMPSNAEKNGLIIYIQASKKINGLSKRTGDCFNWSRPMELGVLPFLKKWRPREINIWLRIDIIL